jgi:Zn finger protein HypA/HybF involved in hydrogenase expression
VTPSRVRWLLFVLLGLMVAAEALARVGGGEGFSGGGRGGGSSSGGGSSGGGGGGDALDLVWLLLWLVIEFPAIGIPLVCLLTTLVALYMAFGGARKALRTLDSGSARSGRSRPSRSLPARKAKALDFDMISKDDPTFSMPVLLDHVQLVHRRATEAAPRKDWAALLPFVGEAARGQLEQLHQGVASVTDVVTAALTPAEVSVRGGRHHVAFTLENARRETLADGTERRVVLTERWTFERAADAHSLPPEAVRRMGCPSCGASAETDAQGRCQSCGTVITDGRMQWLATQVAIASPRRAIQAPSYAPAPGGVEPGYEAPTVVAPELPARLRGLIGRHPDFDPRAFQSTVVEIFTALQAAWSEGRWEQARPYTTDPMFDTLRFWMDRYAAAGLKNRLDEVEVERVEIVDVVPDAWYEAVTVRIWANARDYVVDAQGKVVGGNAKQPRSFSEYWTLLRSAGGPATTKDSKHCPSCGAPLDRVNQAGICGYCGSRITSGEFTWVLSRIAQPEAYRG